MAQTVNFTVTGEQKIHCAGCEERITNALRRLPGIKDVQASAEAQRVAVTLDPTRVSPDRVQAKLEHLGYRVQPVPDRGGARPLHPTMEATVRGLAPERSSS